MLLFFLACTPKDSPETRDSEAADSALVDSADTDGAHTADTRDSPGETGGEDSSSEHTASETAETADTAPVEEEGWRSALYPAGWTPGYAVDGHFLHDFSYAGYHNGEDPLPVPTGPEYSVLDYGADNTGLSDSCPAIQSAIDAASDAGGGVVSLPAGEYRCEDLLTISTSGVTILGEGSGSTALYFTRSDAMSDVSHLSFEGSLSVTAETLLTADVDALTVTLPVEDASAFSVGDDVSVGWVITDEFIEDHGMTGTWVSFNGQWRSFFRRDVVALDTASTPNTITVDVPIRYPALTRDSASVRQESGYLSECGVAGLSVSSVVSWEEAWSNDRSHVIGFDTTKDCWMDDVLSYESPNSDDDRGKHLQSGGVIVVTSKRVTIANTTFEQAQNRGGGGNGYLFEISRASEILITDSVGRAGRHNFIQNWDFGTSGSVFLRTTSEDGEAVYDVDNEWLTWLGYSEFHHSLAMANLIDQSSTTDGWKGANRQDESSGAGHSATQNVFWNLSGDGNIASYQYGDGYVIGTEDLSVYTTVYDVLDSEGTAPEDYTEGLDEGDELNPPSLYEDQLRLRLARGEALWD